MKKLYVDLNSNSYNIIIGYDILKDIGAYIKNIFNGKKILIITDDNIENIYANKIKENLINLGYITKVFSFEHGEKSKNLDTCKMAYDKLIDMKFSRSDLIIAVGGGVVGDLAGFVASTYLRGVKFIQIPTSLLAQVDSSVGGKVAVDLPQGKNLIGSFYQPKLVLIDCDVLNTLPSKFFNDGMGEIIKYSMIKDKNLYTKLLNFNNKDELLENIEDIIYTCCNIKREIVQNDEFDTGERMILNFGHTLGHAIEKVYGFDKITHGEGVCIGMNIISKISEKKALTVIGTQLQIKKILQKYDLPYNIELNKIDEIKEAIKIDKKNLNQKLNLILLKNIGECFIYKSDINFFDDILGGNYE